MEETETTIVFCNGSAVPARRAFTTALIRNQRFQLFMILCVSFFAITRPYQHTPLDRWQAISIITVIGGLVFLTYISVFAVLARFGGRWGIKRFHTLWLLFLTSVGATLAGQWSVTLFGQPSLPPLETGLLCGFHLAVFVAMETLFGIFVLPDVKLHPQPAPPPPVEEPVRPTPVAVAIQPAFTEPPAPAPVAPAPVADIRTIVISGQQLPARAVRCVMSQEHYLSISMFGGEKHFIRARIRDFLGQIPDEFGYCTHRSYWVSWNAIAHVEVMKDSLSVILDDGTELPVARGRRSDFIARWNRRSPCDWNQPLPRLQIVNMGGTIPVPQEYPR